MLARIRKSTQEKDQGFTLIELLVVMIIIGILAAIAIPVFTSQRAKAVDTAARSDVSILGKELATYFVDNTAYPTLAVTGSGANRQYTITRGGVTPAPAAQVVGRVSENVNLAATPITGTNATDWCVQVAATNGTVGVQSYSAARGLAASGC